VGYARRRPKRLAEKLLRIRKALGLSQRQMMERLKVEKRLQFELTYSTISKYERGSRTPPLELVLAYARVANGQMDQIVDDDLDLNF
jgi:transcriptional regulator with XRE-family HTH domain